MNQRNVSTDASSEGNAAAQVVGAAQLYRPEVLAKKATGLSGDVVISIPVSWQVMGYSLGLALVATMLFLFMGSYSRVETVRGVIAPDKGIAAIVPTRAGVITNLYVRQGDAVAAGERLVAISVEEHLAGGGSVAQKIEDAIGQQQANLTTQMASSRDATAAQLAQISAQRSGLSSEIQQVDSQIAFQKTLVASAKADLDAVRSLAERGFVTGRDMKQREDTLVSRQQQLSSLEQTRAARTASLKALERDAEAVTAQAKAQAASMEALKAQIRQQAVTVEQAKSYVLTAPFNGRVSTLSGRVGRVASAQQAIMSIVPDGATLRAELSLPSSAIAFITRGQEVRMAVDAFPYQRFGSLKGTVSSISESATSQTAAGGQPLATYQVIVDLERQSILAFGKEQPLVPDMTLTARIVTERRSLLEWLFEPIFAVRER